MPARYFGLSYNLSEKWNLTPRCVHSREQGRFALKRRYKKPLSTGTLFMLSVHYQVWLYRKVKGKTFNDILHSVVD